jgi:hypothetical protein
MSARSWSALGALLVALALPTTALGQATRTWVSGVGDDANPCSRTAPCTTFAGAFPKTAAGGEIDALDPGDFGPLSISHSMTIRADGVLGGVLVATGSAMTINAPGATVELEGLTLNGQGTASSGVDILAAKDVRIVNSDISGFTRAGIDVEPTSGTTDLIVTNTAIHNNGGDGVLVAPASGAGASAILDNDSVTGSACGLVTSSLGVQATPNFATNCGTNATGAGGAALATSINTSSSANVGQGVFSNGPLAENAIGSDLITGNAVGLQVLDGGTIVSLGSNAIYGNGVNGGPTAVANTDAASIGADGVAGPTGLVGPRGGSGVRGAPGKIELVTCKALTKTIKSHGKSHKINEQQCTGKLVAGTVKFTSAGAVKASVSRAGHVYAVGNGRISRAGTRLTFTSTGRLKAGSYTLTLTRGHRMLGRESVVVG